MSEWDRRLMAAARDFDVTDSDWHDLVEGLGELDDLDFPMEATR